MNEMFVAVLFVLFKRKTQRKKAQKMPAKNRYILNKNCNVFFGGRREYRGRKVYAPLRSVLDKCHWHLAPFVQGYRERSFPVQVKGGSHCPVELMLASARTGYCLTLKSAGLAAKLPFSQAPLWEKMKGNAMSSASRGDRHFPLEGHWKERGKIAIE